MVAARYVPDAGDFIWLTFDPQAGHERSGRRPGLVLSPRRYNQRAGLSLDCPVTSHIKGYPFEAPIPGGEEIEGAVLCDHVKSLDWQKRRAVFINKASADLLVDVRERLRPLLGL